MDPQMNTTGHNMEHNIPQMDPKNGPKMDTKWTQNGPKVDPARTHTVWNISQGVILACTCVKRLVRLYVCQRVGPFWVHFGDASLGFSFQSVL